MGKKSNVTRLLSTVPSARTAATGSPGDNMDLGQDQQSLMMMLTHTTHTVRIRGLNTITTLLKSGNVTAIAQANMLTTIFQLMGDRMMDVGLAATGLMRHVVQICDTSMLATLLGYNLQSVSYNLLQYLSQCFQMFGQGTILSKGHGLYWYNPSYLNMVRMVTHLVKIISSLMEVNNDLCNDFIVRVAAADAPTEQQQQAFQQSLAESQQSGGKVPPPAPPVNFLTFFITILSINIGTIPAHLIPTIHLPFITQLQLDLLHFLRVLSHENFKATLMYLSTPSLIQYLLQEPVLLLTQQQQTTAQTQYSPPPPQAEGLEPQPSTIINCQTDSIYTYQYCQSIVLSNLCIEYQKVAAKTGKTSALATSFTIHSLPHTNIEIAMSIAVIIASMLEQINAQTEDFITNDQQKTTLEGLYQAVISVVKYAVEQVDLNQELAVYTQSLVAMRTTLVTLSNGDLSLLESYNISSAMGQGSPHDSEQFKKQSRQQFKTLNINNRIDPQQQQEQLISSLKQLSSLRDGNELAAEAELDQLSAQGIEEVAPGEAVVHEASQGDEAFTEDEFPLHQLWNDAVSIHNTILTQYFNVKALVTDCMTILLSNQLEDDGDDGAEAAIMKALKNQQTSAQTPHNQLTLFHNAIPQLLQFPTLLSLLNHSYTYIHQAETLFHVPSYFPAALVFTIHDLYSSGPEDYPHFISFVAYQSTLTRINSLNNVLLMLQYGQKYHQTGLFTQNAQNIHQILLTIASSTSIARLPQTQQEQLIVLQEHFTALSSIELSEQVNNPAHAQAGLQKIANILNSTSIDEANIILQTLTTFVSDESLVQINSKLWDSAILKPLKQVVAPIKEAIHATETFSQATIEQIVAQIPPETQPQHLFVSESQATALQNFISYYVTSQAHYQSSTKATTALEHKKYAQNSPQVEFQTMAMTYLSTMAINYPLFGPLMPKIAGSFVSLASLFVALKMNQFNCHLLFQFVNLVIDIFSEDDRLVMAYTSNKLTAALNSFSKVHAEYLTSLKQTKMAMKPKIAAKRGAKPSPAAKTVSLTPAKQEMLIEIQEALEITTEANLNLVGFVEYKRKMKL